MTDRTNDIDNSTDPTDDEESLEDILEDIEWALDLFQTLDEGE